VWADRPISPRGSHRPNGLPGDAWLWLKRESEGLDFRPAGGAGIRSLIEVGLPQDPLAELSRLGYDGFICGGSLS
jgi:hypothetical protein